jgi:hypothetical protein
LPTTSLPTPRAVRSSPTCEKCVRIKFRPSGNRGSPSLAAASNAARISRGVADGSVAHPKSSVTRAVAERWRMQNFAERRDQR